VFTHVDLPQPLLPTIANEPPRANANVMPTDKYREYTELSLTPPSRSKEE